MLRNYQGDCIKAILTNMGGGERRMAISLATGGGKVIIFTELISRLTHPVRPEAEKTLILVHRRELVQQAAKQCEKQCPDKVVDIEMGTSHANKDADIIVASLQSITSRLEKYDAELYNPVLIDECHHAVSPSYMKAMDVNEKMPLAVVVSATVSRFDGVSSGKVMGKLGDSTTMIENEWLPPPRFTTVRSTVDLEGVKETPTGDFDLKGLGQAVNTDMANHVIIQTWIDRASERKSTLVFCVDISHVHSVMDKFRANGIDALEVTSRSPTQACRECLKEFKAGKFPVMVNCGVFTEGTDIPNIDCVILAHLTRSENLITQMIGKGLRKTENTGKTDCHIIDMVANLSRGVVTTPSLFGLDPDLVVSEMTPDQMHAMADKEAEARQKAEEEEKQMEDAKEQGKILAEQAECGIAEEEERRWDIVANKLNFVSPACLPPPPPPIQPEYTNYDDIWDLLNDTSTDQVIQKMSRLAWVSIDSLAAEMDHSGWYNVEEVRALLVEIGRGRVLVMHDSPWRKVPATNQQLEFLKKLRHRGDKDWEDMRKSGTLTKGRVGDMITRVKHGAMRRFEEKKREQEKKKEKEQAKELKRR
ncbi:P-loop containing nucleoside triphosphate hydrolase protein [Tuber indicum]|nr:P-loop containing nucleoside triphosphate hydrolase protein [Tuber indicum]